MPADVAPGQRVPTTFVMVASWRKRTTTAAPREATGWSAIRRPGTVPGGRSLGAGRASPTFRQGRTP
jgi:hypothetical protein